MASFEFDKCHQGIPPCALKGIGPVECGCQAELSKNVPMHDHSMFLLKHYFDSSCGRIQCLYVYELLLGSFAFSYSHVTLSNDIQEHVYYRTALR